MSAPRHGKSPKRRADTWQAQKSDITRVRLLEAAIQCIAELTYPKTTVLTIAERAGVSAGAMQYHFPSRAAVIKAAVAHLHARRLAGGRRDLAHVPEGMDVVEHLVRAYWKHLTEPEFQAFQELVVASRADPELAAILRPAYQSFLDHWRDQTLKAFPEWRPLGEQFHLACNMAQYLMEGMAYGLLNGQFAKKNIEPMLVECAKQLRKALGSPSRARAGRSLQRNNMGDL